MRQQRGGWFQVNENPGLSVQPVPGGRLYRVREYRNGECVAVGVTFAPDREERAPAPDLIMGEPVSRIVSKYETVTPEVEAFAGIDKSLSQKVMENVRVHEDKVFIGGITKDVIESDQRWCDKCLIYHRCEDKKIVDALLAQGNAERQLAQSHNERDRLKADLEE